MTEETISRGLFRNGVIVIPVTKQNLQYLRDTFHSIINTATYFRNISVITYAIDAAEMRKLKALICTSPYPAKFYKNKSVNGDPILFINDLLFYKYPDSDFCIVHPGVIFPKDWDRKIASAAYSDPNIGTVSPMCGDTRLFGFKLSGLGNKTSLFINSFLQYCVESAVYQIPYYAPNCVYIRRDALKAISSGFGKLLSTEDRIDKGIANLLTLEGYYTVITNKVYIEELNIKSLDFLRYLDSQDDAFLINRAHPVTGVRYLLNRYKDYAQSFFSNEVPVQLHVMHSWGGGIEKWVGDFCDADTNRKNLVLKSIGNWGAFGERLALYDHAHSDTPIKFWDLYFPIYATAISHYQYRQVIREILDDYNVDFIMISSFIGHSLDLFDIDRPITIIIHDYYPFCQAIYINYNGVCFNCTKSDLESCAKNNSLNRFFTNVSAMEWQKIRTNYIQKILERDIKLVIPTPSVRRHLVSLIPEFSDKQFSCIPHGARELDNINALSRRKEFGKLRIIILGHLTEQKGLLLFDTMYKQILQIANIYLVGCGEDGRQYRGCEDIFIIERYQQAELTEILEQIRPDIGLLLSIWPETFSYTLSELMMSAIPILATNLGSFGDRIVDGETGFLCDPNPTSTLGKLRDINRNRALLHHVKKKLLSYRHNGLKEMVDEYHALFPNIPIPASVFKMRNNHIALVYERHIPSASDSIEISLEWMSNNIKGKLNDANRIKPWLKELGVALIYIWILVPKLFLKIIKK